MPKVRVLVLRAPGANCDQESAFAFERAGAVAERVHVNRLLERPGRLADYQVLCIPGGFSYGDDLGAGRILGNQIQHHLRDVLHQFKAAGKLVLGICNGFQILTKSGLLLDDDATGRPVATLTNNDSGKFEDRWVSLRTTSGKCVFFKGIESMYLPVAHAEGKFVPRDAATLAALESNSQIVLRYAALGGNGGHVAYPDNPNGSMAAVAGVCDSTGRVCGLMPHPERHIDPTQHPRWTRGPLAAEGDGLQVFRNAVQFFE
ncbi:MAG TPA: phosphoribosylformylglycinamidine synthase I [Pirellulales bacterium]|nr:phosphoribosylformylglycinamidine synthase I [Pirellulales bacterium]